MRVERGPEGELILWLDALGLTTIVALVVLTVACAALWGFAWGRRR